MIIYDTAQGGCYIHQNPPCIRHCNHIILIYILTLRIMFLNYDKTINISLLNLSFK